ncbi:MAG: NAD(P)/FAD-dependent oxidoreductase, partial [Micromonosporaceae bacterium]
MPDVVVVGAGVIGAACAEALGRHGLQVSVYDRGGPASATTASGEGNVLVSDKSPGPELTLARASRRRWPELLAELAELTDAAELTGTGAELTGTGDSGPSDSGPGDAEWEAKGGLVVATAPESADALAEFAATQRAAGVDARTVSATEAAALEPHLTSELAYAVHYPEDGQLNPVAATTALLAGVRQRGGEVVAGVTVTGVLRTRHGAVQGVRTSAGPVSCGAVVNACGPWAGQFAARLGLALAVTPRRGNVLVTAPVPGLVRHKVYDADYVGAVASGEAGVRTSAVVESTRAGTVLIGSSRERVGFDDTIRIAVVR